MAPPQAITDIESLIGQAAKEEQAMANLFELIESDPILNAILCAEGANKDDLKKCYTSLISCGAGQWAKGHWVAASALAFGTTLPFVLRQSNNGRLDRRDDWLEIAWGVLDYFEKGRVGVLK